MSKNNADWRLYKFCCWSFTYYLSLFCTFSVILYPYRKYALLLRQHNKGSSHYYCGSCNHHSSSIIIHIHHLLRRDTRRKKKKKMMITSTSASSLAFGVITLAALSSSVYILLKKCKELKDLQHKYEREMDLRKTERAGRTTAERRLRKELAALIKGQTDGGLIFRPVARAKTPFKGRCGTPRQGQLAPNVKGQLIFETGVSPVSLDSLDQFSHLWVIFLFHQNTNWTGK